MNTKEDTATFQTLPISLIQEWEGNPRKHFGEAKLAELAESIKQQGVLQPIVVRRLDINSKGDRDYQIVCGARRYRAAKIAGVANIPCVVRDLSDREVLELAVIENLQRDDVHPLEEAEGYARLEGQGYDVDMLAAKVGKSTSYIYQRMQLRKLSPEAQEEFYAGHITAGHAVLLARLQDHYQAQLLTELLWDWGWKGEKRVRGKTRKSHPGGVRELKRCIANLTHPLANAVFDTEDASLLKSAGACSACPKRSGADKLDLFDDDDDGEEEPDLCLDSGCWSKKAINHLGQLKKRLAKESALPVYLVNSGYSNHNQIAKPQLQYYEFEKSDSKANAFGINVTSGEAIPIRVKSESKAKPRDPVEEAAKAKRQNALKKRREKVEQEYRETLQAKLEETAPKSLDIAFVRNYAAEQWTGTWSQERAAILKRAGVDSKWSEDRVLRHLKSADEAWLMRFIFLCQTERDVYMPTYGYSGKPSTLLRMCELSGIDAEAIRKEIEAKHPKPKPVQTAAKAPPGKAAKKSTAKTGKAAKKSTKKAVKR